MKINSILNRYIFIEMMAPFILSLFFCTFVLLMAEMVKITNWIVNYDVSVMSILLTFLRMSSDNEIMALKSSGLSTYRLLLPVMIFSLMGLVTTLYITIFVTPRASTAIEDLTFSVAASNVDIGLKQRTFNDDFKELDDMFVHIIKSMCAKVLTVVGTYDFIAIIFWHNFLHY